MKLTAAIAPAASANVNPYVGLLQPVVEPLIPANRWYLFAEPPTTPVYVFGYLNGVEQGEVRWDWPLYEQIAAAMKAAAQELGAPIVWGGDWPSFRDGPHFELDRTAYP